MPTYIYGWVDRWMDEWMNRPTLSHDDLRVEEEKNYLPAVGW